jgi:hypothetical protein
LALNTCCLMYPLDLHLDIDASSSPSQLRRSSAKLAVDDNDGRATVSKYFVGKEP